MAILKSLKHTYLGPDRLLSSCKAAIFNSRQSKFPLGDDPWIRTTSMAVEYIQNHNLILLTSLGMNTWEMTLFLASANGLYVIIVLPSKGDDESEICGKTIRQFNMNEDKTGFFFFKAVSKGPAKKSWPVRDDIIAGLADSIIPVSIRSGGNLEKLLGRFSGKVIDDFRIPYKSQRRPRPRYDDRMPHPDFPFYNILAHFTRTTSSPWPGETRYDFYKSIVESGNEFSHSARATLLRIVESGVICGQARNIRGGFPVVGFTALSPHSFPTLFRYRPRLVNPYFEPYGIGILKSEAERLGLRPVVYGTPDKYEQLPEDQRPFFQSVGSDGRQWTMENEWRHVGNLNLDHITPKSRFIIVPDKAEADRVTQEVSWPIVPLFE